MKNLFLISLLLLSVHAKGYFSLSVANPNSWGSPTRGIISEPMIEIKPMGVYAQVELTFKFSAQSSYHVKDSLEAVLNFDLPANSFIHDSWLWLDENTIIQADVVEKNRAIAIYQGIVIRRRDPSLLIKTGPNSYKLNVYPMTTAYPRKVKITYSVPFNWQSGVANIPLPIDLLNTSQTKHDIFMTVHHNNTFSQPNFADRQLSNYVFAVSPSTTTLLIPASQYANDEAISLTYQTSLSNGVFLGAYPTTGGEGIYQMVLQPSVLGSVKPRNVAFVIDMSSSNSVYDQSQMKQYIESALLNNYNPNDSFSLFYLKNGAVAGTMGWMAATPANIMTAISNMPTINTGSYFETLMKDALAFCKNKPGDAVAILLSNTTNYSNNQASADSMFTKLKTHVGSFQNRIHVVNLSAQAWFNGGQTIAGGELLFSKLTLASGGIHYKYKTATNVGNILGNNKNMAYDLNLPNTLKEISELGGYHTGAFSTDVNVASGFTFNSYDINNYNRYTMSSAYVETGKYYGTIGNGTTVDVQVLTPGGMVNQQVTATNVDNGSDHYVQTWVHKYIGELESHNNNNFANEIIDSSINNRVLCNYTAFLALETGDTINTNRNENEPTLLINTKEKAPQEFKCYPNPFTDNINIEFTADVKTIEIYDLFGRKLFTKELKAGERKLVWDGRDSSGASLPAGIYILVAKTDTESKSIRVQKQ